MSKDIDFTTSRWLIFSNGMIGNTLLNEPVVRYIRETWPESMVDMVVDRPGFELLQSSPHVGEFFQFGKKKASLLDQWKLIRAWRKKKYDVSLHLRTGVRNEFLAMLAGVRLRAGFPLKGSPSYLNLVLSAPEEIHRLENRRMALEQTVGHEVRLKLPILYPTPAASDEAKAFLRDQSTGPGEYVIIHPTGNTCYGLEWTLGQWAEVVLNIAKDRHVVVVCMPDEQAACEKLIPQNERIHYYTGSVTVTSELIRLAGWFLGNDSGPGHMAAAWQKPRLVVYADQGLNYVRWHPLDTVNCRVLFREGFSAEAVLAHAHAMFEGM